MEARYYDWKDVANSKFDRAFTLALLILLFGLMVTPRVDIKKQTVTSKEIVTVDIPPEEREKIKPPEDIVKPVVDLVISDELAADDASDPNAVEQLLEMLGGDIFKTSQTGSSGDSEKPFDYEIYEDPPEPVNAVMPDYPAFARNSGIEGLVYLEVDVYKDGTTGNISVIKSLLGGPGGLDEAAVNAVRKWKFQPGKNGGKAIDTRVIIPIEFTLSN